jgi:hypothetical protein
MTRSWEISRRTFLRGLGTAIALPTLNVMQPSIAHAQSMGIDTPKRLLSFYVPNGIVMNDWTPTQDGVNFDLPPILQPLSMVQDDVLVLTGIQNSPARPDGPGDHASGTGSFLTAAHPFKTEGRDIQNGISMDQVAANAIGDQTSFPSLQFGSEGGSSVGNCDSGYSCAYARNISWSGPATPIAKEVQPQAVFDRLFGGFDPQEDLEARARRKRYKQSILDFVKDDANRLQAKLGKSDKLKIDEYLTSLRELETRLQSMEPEPTSCIPGQRPMAGGDVRYHVQAMCDLMVLAFQCDLTRVITYMLGNAGSNRVYGFLGIGDGHHQISHHQNEPTNISQLTTIDTWEIEQLAYLLRRMKSVQEGESNLLDNSLVFFSSEIEDGNRHRHSNLPIILAGGGGGAIRSGRHIRYTNAPPIANLFISMLQTVGVEMASFGLEGTGPLAGLT